MTHILTAKPAVYELVPGMHLRRSLAVILALVYLAAQTESRSSKSEGNNVKTKRENEDERLEEEPQGKVEEETRKRYGIEF